MYIRSFQIANFKAFESAEILFNQDLNIFTGANNSGKTTMLEALSLWHECFSVLIRQAGKSEANYRKGQWVLGNTQVNKFPFERIKSVRCPNFEDMFHRRDRRSEIRLTAVLADGAGQEISIPFIINESGMNYKIELWQFTKFDFNNFNLFFKNLPNPIGLFYASPISAIQQVEPFVTQPQVADAMVSRASASVLRNRLYSLYRSPDPSVFQGFLDDLSFILTNLDHKVQLYTNSDIQRDKHVIFNAVLNPQATEMDIALLGSGTLQVIEILLNLHHSDQRGKDLNIILLDEPDSHIHRDIQNRLLLILTKFVKNNQIFITTHNESLIRSANLDNLFHLEAKPTGTYRNLGFDQLQKTGPRFTGIYPTALKPVITSLGSSNGLDFINAVEADVLVFVEGEDDARAFDILLKQFPPRKYAFWVLGGVGEVLKQILHYRTVFSKIKNQKSLWDKSVLVIDRDFLNDAHLASLTGQFKARIELKTCIADAYTFESTLLTDFPKLGRLIAKWLAAKGLNVSPGGLDQALEKSYQQHGNKKAAIWQNDEFFEKTSYWYRNAREKLNVILGQKFIDATDIQLQSLVRGHIETCVLSGNYFKLMNKEDVQAIINGAISQTGLVFDIESDFMELMYAVDKSTWFDAWDFLGTI